MAGLVQRNEEVHVPIRFKANTVGQHLGQLILRWIFNDEDEDRKEIFQKLNQQTNWDENELSMPLKGFVGVPSLSCVTTEVDFARAIIKRSSRRRVYLYNKGTAPCEFKITSQNNRLVVSPVTGTIEVGKETVVSVEFFPGDSLEPLNSQIVVESDGGGAVVACTGTVGVPRLHVAGELNLDFGVIQCDTSAFKKIEIHNTGKAIAAFSIALSRNEFIEEDELESPFDHRLNSAGSVDASLDSTRKSDRRPITADVKEKVESDPYIETFNVYPNQARIGAGRKMDVTITARPLMEREIYKVYYRIRALEEGISYDGWFKVEGGVVQIETEVFESYAPSDQKDESTQDAESGDHAADINSSEMTDFEETSAVLFHVGLCRVKREITKPRNVIVKNSGNMKTRVLLDVPILNRDEKQQTVSLEADSSTQGGAASTEKRLRPFIAAPAQLNGRIYRFLLSPAEFDLEPGEEMPISVSFIADDIGLYQQTFEIRCANQPWVQSLILFAKTGMPNVQFADPTESIDFGCKQIGQRTPLSFTLVNHGNASAEFKIELKPIDDDPEDSSNSLQLRRAVTKPLNSVTVAPFQVEPLNGSISPRQSVSICVTFCPSILNKTYYQTLELDLDSWSTELGLIGVGGSSKLVVLFDDVRDQMLKYIDFGTQLIGHAKTRTIRIQNEGNLPFSYRTVTKSPFLALTDMEETTAQIRGLSANGPLTGRTPSSTTATKRFTFDEPTAEREVDSPRLPVNEAVISAQEDESSFDPAVRAERLAQLKSYFKLEPTAAHIWTVAFTPVEQILYEGRIVIESTEREVAVATRGNGGDFKLHVDGSLEMNSIFIGCTYVQKLRITNMGQISTMLEFAIDPPDLSSDLDVNHDASSPRTRSKASVQIEHNLTGVLHPGRSFDLNVRVFLVREGPLSATVWIQPQERELRSKAQMVPLTAEGKISELQFDVMYDVFDIGRVVLSTERTVVRRLMNRSTNPIPFRVELQAQRDSYYRLWTVTPLAGLIEPESAVDFVIKFRSEDSNESDWHPMLVTIFNGNTGQPALNFQLKGSSCLPILHTFPSRELEFRLTALGNSRQRALKVTNNGTGTLELYDISVSQESKGCFTVLTHNLCFPIYLQPHAVTDVTIMFEPSNTATFDGVLEIESNVGPGSISLKGEGAHLEIVENLPDSIDFGIVCVGESSVIEIPITNNCATDYCITSSWTEPSLESERSGTPGPTHSSLGFTEKAVLDHPLGFEIVPNLLRLDGNQRGAPKTTKSIVARFQPPLHLLNNGLPDLKDPQLVDLLTRSQNGSIEQLLYLSMMDGSVRQLPLVARVALQQVQISTQLLDFGELFVGLHDSREFTIRNPTKYSIKYVAFASHGGFKCNPCFGIITAGSFVRITVTFVPTTVINSEEMEPEERPAIVVELLDGAMPAQKVGIKALTKDYTFNLDKIRLIQFDTIFLGERNVRIVELENVSDHEAEFEIHLPEDCKDAFVIPPRYLKGKVGRRHAVGVEVVFNPIDEGTYVRSIDLVTDDGVVNIKLQGLAVVPTMSVSIGSLDYGCVGVGHPAKKEVVLTNTCPLPYSIQAADVPSGFLIEKNPKYLPPHTPVRFSLVFAPTMYILSSGTMRFVTVKSNMSQRDLNRDSMSRQQFSNAPANRIVGSVDLVGMGAKTSLKLSTGSIKFGSIPCGLECCEVFTLVNDGEVPLQLKFVDSESEDELTDHITEKCGILHVTPSSFRLLPSKSINVSAYVMMTKAGSALFRIRIMIDEVLETRFWNMSVSAEGDNIILSLETAALLRGDKLEILQASPIEDERQKLDYVLRPYEHIAPISIEHELLPVTSSLSLQSVDSILALPPPLAPDVVGAFRRWYYDRVPLRLSTRTELDQKWKEMEMMLSEGREKHIGLGKHI
eukprot:GILJ01011028.1.p1 GENE.GILJ01011028.1~~GILJ01011028.1.p1  ORF type:complete len:1892 (-),score=334.87 GILJ01011028.1:108-5783(-)